MTSYSFGDIILVPFPFTNQTIAKKRPAVVISSDVYNQEHPDLIVMAITSQRYIATMLGEVETRLFRVAKSDRPLKTISHQKSDRPLQTTTALQQANGRTRFFKLSRNP